MDGNIDLNSFSTALATAYQELTKGQRLLQNCGFHILQSEGWSRFSRSTVLSRGSSSHGDGHTSSEVRHIRTAEDDIFQFIFTWLKDNEQEKGWTIHYGPKHPPLSIELQSVFKFLELKAFQQCPEFGFESCSWRHIEFRGSDVFDSNTEAINTNFDAHPQNFSLGIQALLSAQATMEQIGMGFLPSFARPGLRVEQEITGRVLTNRREAAAADRSDNARFDVAISFAGTERSYAETLATKVKGAGFKVFYDMFFPEELWGKNLGEFSMRFIVNDHGIA